MSNAYRSVLESGGVTPTGDAVAADVLAGKTFSNANAVGVTGTMVNRGAVSQTLSGGQSYTIPEGYHNGSGTVTALSSGYNIVNIYNLYTSGGTYNDITVSANIGDYLVLSNSNSEASISATGIEETTEISIPGALKIYKVTSTLSSASVRVLMQSGNSGGAVIQIRTA